jgi:sugar/nucleoside kinase (ribokinase family)
MDYEIVTAGHICLDIFPDFSENREKVPDEIFSPGKLTELGNVAMRFGGSVANTGIYLGQLGIPALLVGKIGDDMFGRALSQLLKENHAPDEGIIIDPAESTSYSLIFEIPGFDKITLHHQGANSSFHAGDIDFNSFHKVKIFHFGYPNLMDRMCEATGKELVLIFKRAREMGLCVTLDMAPIDPYSKSGQIDWPAFLVEVMPCTDIFLPSFEELYFMLFKEAYLKITADAPSADFLDVADLSVLPKMADRIRDMGAGALVVKCGKHGAYLNAFDEGIELFRSSFQTDRVRTATGCGDAFIAGFFASLLKGRDMKQSLKNGCASGALHAMSEKGAGGMMPLEMVEEKINDGWKTMIHE